MRDIQKQVRSIEGIEAQIRDKHSQVLNPHPIEGIVVGLGEDILDPEIKVPKDEDFILPHPLEDLIDKSKVTHRFLPNQGDIDWLIAHINKKVLTDTNLCGISEKSTFQRHLPVFITEKDTNGKNCS